ncbi:pentapeptide repeat-containing protein [Paenibacillus sp. P25]|nr:pentapeptide repeat-containing protein [Paenibacillus sp. P25]
MPPEWHPDYREGQRPKPVSFMNCDLRGSVFSDCNLGGVALRHCNFAGMTINGVPVEKLLEAYREHEERNGRKGWI